VLGFLVTLGGEPSADAGGHGEWLAGDLHVHTCYSHDAYCPEEDGIELEDLYTLSIDVEGRFLEASLRGLDYLAITDHNDVRSASDPGFGAYGLIGVPGYEKSLRGHAQMLGATHVYDVGDREATDVVAIADELRASGGVFQINHPADSTQPLTNDCTNTEILDWGYGFDVAPDTLEVWSISHLYQPPLPSAFSIGDGITYWECWLNRGYRIGATGGSDSHWLSTTAIQGPGNPTTWVFAEGPTLEGLLDGLRSGRTSISNFPPLLGGPQLLLEGDSDGSGAYDAMIGDAVPPGSAMRVRTEGTAGFGLLEVRANGRTILEDVPVTPGEWVEVSAPDEPGWVRATLRAPDLEDERASLCDELLGSETTYCRNRLAVLAMTSPIYVESVDDQGSRGLGPEAFPESAAEATPRVSAGDTSGDPLPATGGGLSPMLLLLASAFACYGAQRALRSRT
jgi:hypothetical protein